mmetsp:Transcript_12876/g.40152  ORF Transcript_12876/g.40152 Transcript_12876/m.40152 type:complete len:327 (-) Transcript_12876:261-1241(-)
MPLRQRAPRESVRALNKWFGFETSTPFKKPSSSSTKLAIFLKLLMSMVSWCMKWMPKRLSNTATKMTDDPSCHRLPTATSVNAAMAVDLISSWMMLKNFIISSRRRKFTTNALCRGSSGCAAWNSCERELPDVVLWEVEWCAGLRCSSKLQQQSQDRVREKLQIPGGSPGQVATSGSGPGAAAAGAPRGAAAGAGSRRPWNLALSRGATDSMIADATTPGCLWSSGASLSATTEAIKFRSNASSGLHSSARCGMTAEVAAAAARSDRSRHDCRFLLQADWACSPHAESPEASELLELPLTDASCSAPNSWQPAAADSWQPTCAPSS